MPKKDVTNEEKELIAPPSRLYRRIAYTFLTAAILLFVAVSYTTLSGATITIKPKREVLTATFGVTVSSQQGDFVKGKVLTKNFSKSETLLLKGDEGTRVSTQARGTATIINKTTKNQALVKTTRLLTSDNKLFRIDNSVNVPAGGSVDVAIYSDEAGPVGEIEASSFVIPGLRENLQDKIYAETKEPTCCGTKLIRVVTEKDLQAAQDKVMQDALAVAKEDLRGQLGSEVFGGEIFVSDPGEVIFDVLAGQESESVGVSMNFDVVGIFFDENAVFERAKTILQGLAGEEKELVELDPERVEVSVQSIDIDKGTAQLAVSAPGMLVLKSSSELFDFSRLAGLSKEAAATYFKRFRSIDSVEIRCMPPWTGYLPKMTDRIKIEFAE